MWKRRRDEGIGHACSPSGLPILEELTQPKKTTS